MAMPITKYKEYEAGRIVIVPGREPHVFYLVLSPEHLFKAGILQRILEVFSSRVIPILQLKTSIKPGKEVNVIIIADLTGSPINAGSLIEALKEVEGVTEVRHTEPVVDGVAMDVWSFPIKIQGTRVIISTERGLAAMLKRGWKTLGTPFAAILYHAYFGAGKDLYSMMSEYSERAVYKIILASNVLRLLGYGVVEFVEVLPDEARVRVYESFECSLFKGSDRPRGAIMRGLLAGFIAAIWDAELDHIGVEEVKCIARGDEYCEYRIWLERQKS